MDQAHPLHGKIPSPLPPFHLLKEVVEIAYLASLEQEEGRPIRFALVMAGLSTDRDPMVAKQESEYLFHLKSPLPFSVNSITKFAPALDPAISAMAIGTTGKAEEMSIWGVFTFSPTEHPFSEIPVWVYGELGYRPDYFTIYANDAGSLVISRHHSQIGRILNGDFVPATPSPFTVRSLGRHLMEFIKDQPLYKTYEAAYWRIYRDVIEMLLSEASARGHGSIFIFLPAGSLKEKYYLPRFHFQEQVGIQPLLGQLLQDDLDVPTSIAVRKTVAERIRFLSQLGVIDGAVILSTELDLVCFGAMLIAPAWKGSIITGPDGSGEDGGEPLNPGRLGTRHNAGIAFAGAYEGSIVFVISQDGPVRVFMRAEDRTLLYWPDCCSVSMTL
ncbi:MAG: putative sensor domain DACNV-containing protein [Desulfomonilia bacterium]